jgi:Bacterial regulatory proteins, luxR family
VAAAVGAGASNAEIATALYMSEATVKTHMSRQLGNLDVSNRVEIANPGARCPADLKPSFRTRTHGGIGLLLVGNFVEIGSIGAPWTRPSQGCREEFTQVRTTLREEQ